jgi:succinoglycan biosynthesis transport protein ExoP
MIGSTKAINAPKAGNAAPEVESDGFGRAILRHKWMIFTSVLIGLTAATWLAARQVPLYASHSTVLFEQYVKAGSADAVVSDPFLNAQTDLMLSPAVLDAAATQLLHAHLKTLADSTNISGTLQQTIKARVRKEDGTITLSYVCLVASDSATIINTVVDSYRDYEIKHRQTTATDAFGELQQAKLHADAEMNSILGKIQEFKSRNPDFSMDDRIASNLATAKLAKLNQDLTDAQANLLEVQAKYDSLAAQLGPQETAGKNASADDADVDLAGVQSELDKASANLDSLTSKGLPPTDSSVQDARAYLARVRQKLSVCQRNASYADLTKLKAEVDLAQRRQSEMQTAFDQQKHAVAALNIKSAEFSALQDQQQNLQRSSDDLDSKIHQINLAMDIPLDIRVLEKAQPAIAPIDVRSRYMGIGGLSGLLLGFGLSLGLYLTDGRLRTPLEVGNAMGLPVLGVIPHQTKSLSIADIGFKSHTDPMSDVAEAARSVRTALFSAARSTPIKTVLVTSPTHGEGKTAFAVNLAIAMAQAGSRTLLVDASFGEPILQKMFEIRKITGLSNVLAGYITYEKTISRTPVERAGVC